jgi:Holliday junction resolvasome RuvABC endonuclease subunit
MIVAGFDLATTSGCAVLRGATVLHIEAFRARGETDGEVFRSFRKWFHTTLTTHQVERVAIEQPLVTDIHAPATGPKARPGEMRNPVTMKTYLRLYGLRAHAVEICARLDLPVVEIHQASWRKAFAGNGRAGKDEVLALARRIVPGLKSKDASDALGVAWALNGQLRAAAMKRPGDLFAGNSA